MRDAVTKTGKIEVIDRTDGEVVDRIHAVEAARRLANYHNAGDDADRRRFQLALEHGIEQMTAGFVYRLASSKGIE